MVDRVVFVVAVFLALSLPVVASVPVSYGTWNQTADGSYELLMLVPPSDGGRNGSSSPSANQSGDLFDLWRAHTYEWALTIPGVPTGYSLDSVSLQFKNLTDYRYAPDSDKLFISLLDTPKNMRIASSGRIGTSTNYVNRWKEKDGNGAPSNYFAGWPGNDALLAVHQDTDGYNPRKPSTWADYQVNVTDPAQLGWIGDGEFGWGFDPDPDARFYSSGITLTAYAAHAPELPPACLLGALPVLGLVLRRFRTR